MIVHGKQMWEKRTSLEGAGDRWCPFPKKTNFVEQGRETSELAWMLIYIEAGAQLSRPMDQDCCECWYPQMEPMAYKNGTEYDMLSHFLIDSDLS